MDWSSFVEGHVTGLCFLGDKLIKILVNKTDKRSCAIILKGVDRFVAAEVREQNIIDRIQVWDSATPSVELRELISVLVGVPTDGKKADAYHAIIEKNEELIRSGEYVLFEIEPVYGMSIISLVKEISVLENLA